MRRRSKVLLYDESGWVPRGTSALTQAVLTAAWACGTRMFRGASIGASSWGEALEDLERHQSDHGSVRELHVWGHGGAGRPYLGPKADLELSALVTACPNLEVVWWRSCSVHASVRFARSLADLGVVSVGHCSTISWPNPLRQVDLCALRPGEAPFWRMGQNGWVNGRGERLPSVSTLRNRIPYGIEAAWSGAQVAVPE